MEEPTAITLSRSTDFYYQKVIDALNGKKGYQLHRYNGVVYLNDDRDGYVVYQLPVALGQLVSQAL